MFPRNGFGERAHHRLGGEARRILVQIAGHGAVAIGLEERWRGFAAARRDGRATRGELAPGAGGVVDRGRRHCGVGHPGPRGAGLGDRRQQELGIRMPRLLDHQLHVTGLGDRPAIEHDDVVADLVGRRQVVRDVDDRDAQLGVHPAQRRQNGGAQRRVHHRYWLVGQDHARLQQERPRHHHALPLAAGELVREAAKCFFGAQAHCAQDVLDQGSRRCS